MIALIKFPNNNGKSAVYTGGNIHGLYCYLEINEDPTTLTTSSQFYHYFGLLSFINNDTETIQPVIPDLCMRKKSIYECFEKIGHKDD